MDDYLLSSVLKPRSKLDAAYPLLCLKAHDAMSMVNNTAESVHGINADPIKAIRRLRRGKGVSPSVLELSSIRCVSSRVASFSWLPVILEKGDMMVAAVNDKFYDDYS